jgi:protein gp37
MSVQTQIGWTESTWNPWIGCSKVSAGCRACYMFTFRARVGQDPSVVTRTKPTTFDAPRSKKWLAPRRIFTCSWSDFFHEAADAWRADAWEVIRQTPQHVYQILTKRPERLAGHLPWTDLSAQWDHVWLGVSVENQTVTDQRIPLLLRTSAAHRFLSVEPLLGPVDLRPYLDGLDWVIIGGESGPGFRPMQIARIEQIVADCVAAAVSVFVKQDSALKPGQRGRLAQALWAHKWTSPLPTVAARGAQ